MQVQLNYYNALSDKVHAIGNQTDDNEMFNHIASRFAEQAPEHWIVYLTRVDPTTDIWPTAPCLAPQRYLVFGFDTYYAGGGMEDLIGSARTKEQAIEVARNARYRDYYQFYDTKTGQVFDSPDSFMKTEERTA